MGLNFEHRGIGGPYMCRKRYHSDVGNQREPDISEDVRRRLGDRKSIVIINCDYVHLPKRREKKDRRRGESITTLPKRLKCQLLVKRGYMRVCTTSRRRLAISTYSRLIMPRPVVLPKWPNRARVSQTSPDQPRFLNFSCRFDDLYPVVVLYILPKFMDSQYQ